MPQLFSLFSLRTAILFLFFNKLTEGFHALSLNHHVANLSLNQLNPRMKLTSTKLNYAAFESIEMIVAELRVDTLPPAYVPAIFAIAVAVGVGVLQFSLGDVYAQEADLGPGSGANAKKEMERKSKSYFKKSKLSLILVINRHLANLDILQISTENLLFCFQKRAER